MPDRDRPFFNPKSFLMKMNRLKTGFESFSDSNFETKGTNIYDSMLSNSYFPSPIPDLSVVQEALQVYSAAVPAAQGRDRDAVAVKNQARETLTVLLIQLANYVMTVANGNKTMLISSGFDLAGEGEPTPIVKPAGITLADGPNAGELVVKVTAVKGARSYLAGCTPDPLTDNSEWTEFVTTTSKYTFKNLPNAVKYWCRVAAVGSHDQVVYSDAVCRVVQ
jgi:hypothetical protein